MESDGDTAEPQQREQRLQRGWPGQCTSTGGRLWPWAGALTGASCVRCLRRPLRCWPHHLLHADEQQSAALLRATYPGVNTRCVNRPPPRAALPPVSSRPVAKFSAKLFKGEAGIVIGGRRCVSGREGGGYAEHLCVPVCVFNYTPLSHH